VSEILIKNGQLIYPGRTEKADILIQDEKISRIAPTLSGSYEHIIDATGKYILPGFIDYASIAWDSAPETLTSISQTALNGGITTLFLNLPADPKQDIDRIESLAVQSCRTDFSFHGTLTHFSALTADFLKDCVQKGILGFHISLLNEPEWSDGRILALLWQLKQLGGTLMVHAENKGLVDFLTNRLQKLHKDGPSFHPYTHPAEAELEAVTRLITLNQFVECPLYFTPVTTTQTLQLLQMAKQNKFPVFAESRLPYLLFNQSVYEQEEAGPFCLIPSLRSKADQQALWEAVREGTIDVLSAHYEYKEGTKNTVSNREPFPDFSRFFTSLFFSKKLSMNQIIRTVSEEPARLFGLFPRKGILRKDSDADLLLFEPHRPIPESKEKLYSPFHSVLIRGRWMVKEHLAFPSGHSAGKFIPALF